MMNLTSIELRVLASLIEKQICTPEYYPLSMNALINACNQKLNRNPVVEYNEIIIETGLQALKAKQLARKVYDGAGRVPKYSHLFHQGYNLKRNLVSILVELMLRGPQTPGELKSRCRRLHIFQSVSDVLSALNTLMNTEEPMVFQLAMQSGSREVRYSHTFSDEDVETGSGVDVKNDQDPGPNTFASGIRMEEKHDERFESMIRRMEVEIISLRKELCEIRNDIQEIKQNSQS